MSVEFCNSKAFKIDSDELKGKIIAECENLLKTKLKKDHFPGPQPVTVEIKDFEKLKKEEYMICEKSDGERGILLLININCKPMCFMINRNNEYYFLDLSFKKEVFEGTIMDGEIIKTKNGSWNYLIHDTFCYNGQSFLNESHRLRYACIIDLIIKRYLNKETDCLNIKTKLFYQFGPKIEQTWKHIQLTTENKIDGLIFTPVNGPIKFGRDNDLLKWKEIHTMDLLVKQASKKITLHYIKAGSLILFKTFTKDSPNFKIIMDYLNKNKIITDVIIEFKYLNCELFEPYRIRTDKSVPNGEITVNNTIKNIEEAIRITDFYTPEPELDLSKLKI
jgi:hypothetical protein